MFVVGDNVFKIFKQGLVYAERSNEHVLTYLTEDQLSSVDTDVVHFCIPISVNSDEEHEDCNFKWKQKNTPSGSHDRIYIEIETRVILNNITTVVKAYNLHRALLVWAPSRHNLSLNSKIEFHTADNNDNWSTYMVQKSETGHVFILTSNVYERSIDNISHSAQNYFWIFYNYPDYHHYYSYEIIASYPGHNPEELSSN